MNSVGKERKKQRKLMMEVAWRSRKMLKLVFGVQELPKLILRELEFVGREVVGQVNLQLLQVNQQLMAQTNCGSFAGNTAK